MADGARYEYAGDPALLPAIDRALHQVIDPEMALDIVELGLVYAVEATPDAARVRMTMTSAACPVAELIMDQVYCEMQGALGPNADVDVELCWEPPWGPERMSPRARAVMDWD